MAFTGKIRVKKNIGKESVDFFGIVGTEIDVLNGEFVSCGRFFWEKDGERFKNLKDINDYFGFDDVFKTEFELVDDYFVKVIKNIGSKSKDSFGPVGTEYKIKHGILIDKTEFKWGKSSPVKNIDELNKLFGDPDKLQTVFELIIK